ncbi:NHL repeat-containing protein 2 [Hordeum vulgare]|nr:NHL repeat-containing protein 2 [Hordeum vulgare]
MTAGGEALWESLSTKMKHEVVALAVAWQSHRARRIEVGLPTSSPKVSDDEDDPAMETGSDDITPVARTCARQLHHGAGALQRPHGGGATCVDAYIYDERMREEAIAAMVVMNPNFIAEQHVIYDVVRAQAAVCCEVIAAKAQL